MEWSIKFWREWGFIISITLFCALWTKAIYYNCLKIPWHKKCFITIPNKSKWHCARELLFGLPKSSTHGKGAFVRWTFQSRTNLQHYKQKLQQVLLEAFLSQYPFSQQPCLVSASEEQKWQNIFPKFYHHYYLQRGNRNLKSNCGMFFVLLFAGTHQILIQKLIAVNCCHVSVMHTFFPRKPQDITV